MHTAMDTQSARIGPRPSPRAARLAALIAAALCAAHGAARAPAEKHCRPDGVRAWIWISPDEIRQLPMSGPGWDARGAPWFANRGVYAYAQRDTSAPLVGDQDDAVDVYTLAKAMVWLRLRQESPPPEDPEPYRAAVQAACLAARGTELQGPHQSTLALGRNLFGYVAAADLIDWDDSVPGRTEDDFRAWVARVRDEVLSDGGTVFRTLVEAHEGRANNWGLMCGTSRLAAAIYLCDGGEEKRCWDVFRRWLGDEGSPFAFPASAWGGLSWQADRAHPTGINPLGAKKRDCADVRRPIGGVLPEEMRRAGPFDTIAPCEPDWVWPAFPDRHERNYNWNAMQAVVVQAVLHGRRERDPWTINDFAIARAFFWLYQSLHFPVTHVDAGGDDHWLPHLANKIYPLLALPEPELTRPGQQVGYLDWMTLSPQWP